jgi:hypothetical protein
MIDDCECKNWARVDSRVCTKHNKLCSHYDPESDALIVLQALLRGIEDLSADTDGIPEQVWEAYKNAKNFIYDPIFG